MKIIIDTNFILTCMQRKIDFISLSNELFDEEIEFIVPKEVIEELEVISERKGEKTIDKESAKVALKFIKKMKINVILLKTKNVDDGLMSYVNKNNVILATMDRGLKKRVSGKILSVKTGKMLEII